MFPPLGFEDAEKLPKVRNRSILDIITRVLEHLIEDGEEFLLGHLRSQDHGDLVEGARQWAFDPLVRVLEELLEEFLHLRPLGWAVCVQHGWEVLGADLEYLWC